MVDVAVKNGGNGGHVPVGFILLPFLHVLLVPAQRFRLRLLPLGGRDVVQSLLPRGVLETHPTEIVATYNFTILEYTALWKSHQI